MITTELLESRRYLATFSVTNTNDTGPGSLRKAMLDAAASTAADVVAFNIPGTGVHTIKPLTGLPVLQPGDSLDGTTQPGYAGAPRIEIDGSLQNADYWSSGVQMEYGTALKGLSIINFDDHGVTVRGYEGAPREATIIQSNYLGLRADGVTPAGNQLAGIIAWSRTTIGGPLSSQRNVASANGVGIIVSTGTGSSTTFDGPVDGTVIQGNYIGTDASGTLDRGNGNGLEVDTYLGGHVDIGGTVGNRIAFNKSAGIRAFHYAFAPADGPITIRVNEIYSNGGPGIDTGPRGLNFDSVPDTGDLNRPVITEIVDQGTTWRVKGTLPPRANELFFIDFYANTAHEPTGYGEGANWVIYQGFSTDANGVGTFDFPVPKVAGMPVISVTATDSRGETSEFSNTLLSPPPFGHLSVDMFNDDNLNGTYDAGETKRLRSATLAYIDLNRNGQPDADEPSATGLNLNFYNVPAGSHPLRTTLADGYIPTLGETIEVQVIANTNATVLIGTTLGTTGAIRGRIFTDQDSNGSYTPGEPVHREQVILDLNKNGIRNSGEPAYLAGQDGVFQIPNLVAGSYSLLLDQGSLGPPMSRSISVVAGEVTVQDFAIPNYGSISGQVYVDEDGSGTLNVGDTSIAITLFIDANGNNTLDGGERTTQTTGFNYGFAFLLPGQYSVRAVMPDGFTQFTADAPVTVNGGVASSYLVGLLPPPAPLPASISGRTYNDNNANGIFDTGDVLITGKTVFLDANANNKLDTGERSVTSNSSGVYTFTNLAAGSYFVRRVFPTGYKASNPLRDYTLVAGQAITGADIGSVTTSTVVTPPGGNPPPADPKNASIGGRTYNDNNANGIFDTGDSLITGKTVFLDANNNGKLDTGEKSTKTSSTGAFSFTGLSAGTYYVRRVFPTGYKASNPPRDYTLVASQMIANADIGSVTSSTVVTPPGDNPPPPPPPPPDNTTGSISGFLFWDSDRDGKFDTGESYQTAKTVFIDLDDDNILDANERKLTSDSQGRFRFDNLTAGTYLIKRVVPSGYKITTAKQVVTLGAGQIFSGVAIGTSTN